MTTFIGSPNFSHATTPKIGILLTNLGTPQAPTPQALRQYLGEFLSDHRVVEIPKVLWRIILHGIILRTRPKKSAKNYASIWTEDGSPLLCISKQQTAKFESILNSQLQKLFEYPKKTTPVTVALGMRYGTPSIASALETLRQEQCEKLVVLPLYPQYAGATTGSTFDALSQTLVKWRWVPELHFINHYHDTPGFISACAQQIKSHWAKTGEPERLVLSYHGVPERQLLQGDPYHCHCHKTTRLITQALGIDSSRVITCFQSRFGKAKWLEPYTDKTLIALAKSGIKHVSVFCPGFSADCLETLEEIAVENKAYFIEHGGKQFDYIPCLNAEDNHIQALIDRIMPVIQPWCDTSRDTALCQKLAKTLGAHQ